MKNKKFLTIVCLILIIILSSCILFLVNRNSYNNNENPLVNTTLEGDVKIKKMLLLILKKQEKRKDLSQLKRIFYYSVKTQTTKKIQLSFQI